MPVTITKTTAVSGKLEADDLSICLRRQQHGDKLVDGKMVPDHRAHVEGKIEAEGSEPVTIDVLVSALPKGANTTIAELRTYFLAAFKTANAGLS